MDIEQLKKRFIGMIANVEYWLKVPEAAMNGYVVEYDHNVTLAGDGDYYFEDVVVPDLYAKEVAEKLAKSVTARVRDGSKRTFYNGKVVEVREWLKQRLALNKECLKLLSDNKTALEEIVHTEKTMPRYGIVHPNTNVTNWE